MSPPQDPKGVSAPVLSLPLGPCALGPIFWCSGPEAARRCQVSRDRGTGGQGGQRQGAATPCTPN